MTTVEIRRDTYQHLRCPKCGRELTAGTAIACLDDQIELVCAGCHVTLGTIDLEPPMDDGDDW